MNLLFPVGCTGQGGLDAYCHEMASSYRYEIVYGLEDVLCDLY